MAELSVLSHSRNLTHNEKKELEQCLKINEVLAYEEAKLKNLSLIAFEANDIEWQHEICARIENIKYT